MWFLPSSPAGLLSWFASTRPDGLEWSISKIIGKTEPAEQEQGLPKALKDIQEKTALMPDYDIKPDADAVKPKENAPSWPGIETGTSVAGIVGAILVLGLILLIGMGIRTVRRRHP